MEIWNNKGLYKLVFFPKGRKNKKFTAVLFLTAIGGLFLIQLLAGVCFLKTEAGKNRIVSLHTHSKQNIISPALRRIYTKPAEDKTWVLRRRTILPSSKEEIIFKTEKYTEEYSPIKLPYENCSGTSTEEHSVTTTRTIAPITISHIHNAIDQNISMEEELLDINDYDYGYAGSMIIRNDEDIKGFIYLSVVWGIRFRPSETIRRGIMNLSEAVEKYTSINSHVGDNLYLTDNKLNNYPFIIMCADDAFELTVPERERLLNYLQNGGFVLVDNATPWFSYGKAEASLRKMIKETIPNARFAPISEDHQIYKNDLFYSFGPPVGVENHSSSLLEGFIGARFSFARLLPEQRIYLEGIWIDERLAVVYSNKGYSVRWADYSNNEAQLRFGVNLLIYALTQENSMVQKRMAKFTL